MIAIPPSFEKRTANSPNRVYKSKNQECHFSYVYLPENCGSFLNRLCILIVVQQAEKDKNMSKVCPSPSNSAPHKTKKNPLKSVDFRGFCLFVILCGAESEGRYVDISDLELVYEV